MPDNHTKHKWRVAVVSNVKVENIHLTRWGKLRLGGSANCR